MIQAGRNGIIFHSCHAAFPFLHLSLSFGCAISFCKKQPFVKSSVRFSEKQGSFLFPFCPLFFLPDGNMAVPRYPVPPFVATSLIFPSAVPQPVVSSCSVCSHLNSVRPNYTKIPADSADLQPKRAPLCRWTDCTFTSPATTVFRSFSE